MRFLISVGKPDQDVRTTISTIDETISTPVSARAAPREPDQDETEAGAHLKHLLAVRIEIREAEHVIVVLPVLVESERLARDPRSNREARVLATGPEARFGRRARLRRIGAWRPSEDLASGCPTSVRSCGWRCVSAHPILRQGGHAMAVAELISA